MPPVKLHVDEMHRRERLPRGSIQQLPQLVVAGLSQMIGLHRWCGASEYHSAAALAGPPDGHLAGVVTGLSTLFIRAVVLFVDDHQTQFPKGREDRRARTQRHPAPTFAQRPPLLAALLIGEPRVEHRHGITQSGSIALHRLGGQRDFGYQHQGCPTLG